MRRPKSKPIFNLQRFAIGFGWGVIATVVMTVFMMLGVVFNINPMPQTVPLAIIARFLGADVQGGWAAAGVIAHYMYGGLWGGLLAIATYPVTLSKGVLVGVGLWGIMNFIIFPSVGWGVLASEVSGIIAFSTLFLHLIYGVMIGGLIDRGKVKIRYHKSLDRDQNYRKSA